VLLLAAIASAAAADFPPPLLSNNGVIPTITPNYTWGGLYIGLNGGYAFGTSNWTDPNNPGNSPTPGTSSGDFGTSGGLFGATFGANFAASSLVLGVEADLDWSSIKGSATPANGFCTLVVSGSLATGTTAAGSTCNTSNNWLGTARLRIGYAFDRILVFGTGGAAFGNVQTGLTGSALGLAPASGSYQSTVTAGWTLGAGVEMALAESWSAKIEYLFVDLNAACNQPDSCGIDTISLSGAVVPANNAVKFTANIVRFGVNYRFGGW
jgi:outer membrane immunogenic protein